MKKNRKLYAMLAFLTAVSMMAAGCENSDGNNDNTSVSINVIGAETSGSSTETAIVTDINGETVTGLNGDPLTEAVGTTAPTGTLNYADFFTSNTDTMDSDELNISENKGERYAYSTLTDEEKKLYDDIVSGIEGLRFKICDEDAYSLEEWTKIYGLVYNQEPQLFYMGSKIKVGKLFYLTKDIPSINQMQKSIDEVADKLVDEANSKSTTFEKLKVFHDYLVLNSTFELKEDGSYDYNATIYNAFGSNDEQGNIQCAGYAKAIQYLCDKTGIPCMVVTGETTKGQSHAWNVVKVDGEWYNLDVTWDDPVLNTPNYKNIRYNYFLVPDAPIHNVSHLHVSQKQLSSGTFVTYFTPPACTKNDQNYFVKNNLVYSDFASADAALRTEIEKASKEGTRTAQIMVSSQELYNEIYDNRMDYNTYAKSFDGVKGVSDECVEGLLLIEFDVIYN